MEQKWIHGERDDKEKLIQNPSLEISNLNVIRTFSISTTRETRRRVTRTREHAMK